MNKKEMIDFLLPMTDGLYRTGKGVDSLVPGYDYKSKKGTASLIFPSWCSMGKYEIMCTGIDDIERFETIEEAENRIKELIG